MKLGVKPSFFREKNETSIEIRSQRNLRQNTKLGVKASFFKEKMKNS
jgi:hypothetical protein